MKNRLNALICHRLALHVVIVLSISSQGRCQALANGPQAAALAGLRRPEHCLDGTQCENPKRLINRLFTENTEYARSVYKMSHPWLFDSKFIDTITNGLEQGNATSKCSKDIAMLLADILKGDLYTLKVVDALGKIPSGLTAGNIMWIGSYDVCTNIRELKDQTNEVKFQGQHCLTHITGPALGPELSQIGGFGIGFCAPDTCSAAELKTIIDLDLGLALEYFNIPTPEVANGTIFYTTVSCAHQAPLTNADIVAIVLTSIVVLLCICGTLFDIVKRILETRRLSHAESKTPDDEPAVFIVSTDKLVSDNEVCSPQTSQTDPSKTIKVAAGKDFVSKVFMSFSVITNGEKLLSPGVREGQLSALNGIRVISMWWVILAHTYFFVVISPSGILVDNSVFAADITRRFTFQAILNGSYSVDSFFFLSGLLAAYLLLRNLNQKQGKINWPLLYFHRFWRLTPVYMFCIMISVSLFLHIPRGPFMRDWDATFGSCQKYWWTNLLYINNFVPSKMAETCMSWTWYLANDMQFFIISPPIIYLLYRFRYAGYSLVLALLLACLLSTGLQARLNSVADGGQNAGEPGDTYVKPWNRIAPYLVGIMTGYFIYIWENNGRHKIYKSVVVMGWCLAIAINISVLYGTYGPNHTGVDWSRDVGALYASTSRFAWALGLGWLSFACITGYGGPVNTFLSWQVWAPLGRLTYCTYLIHLFVMFTHLGSMKTLINLNTITMSYFFIGNVVVSYLVAFVVSITVESPVMGLEKVIFKRN